jgi:hypothetical protein
VTPAPSLTEIIDAIRADSPSTDPVEQLVTAAEMVAAISDISDSALGFFVDQCRRSGRSWTEISSALGVTKQAAHKRFTTTERTTELLTARAKAALFAAGQEAIRLGHNYVGTEHLLLGLLDQKSSVAGHVLADHGIARKAVRERVAAVVPPLPGFRASAPGPYTPRATQCLTRATSEALTMGHHYVGTEHLLLAVAADADGLAARILGDLDTTHDDLRAAVIAKLSGFGS